MDTKLKNLSRKWQLKAIAYLLIVGCATLILHTVWSVWQDFDISALRYDSYEKSQGLYDDTRNFIEAVLCSEGYYQSREAVVEGKYVSQNDIQARLQEYYNEWVGSNGLLVYKLQKGNEFGERGVNIEVEWLDSIFKQEQDLSYESFLTQYDWLEDAIRAQLIENDLQNYDNRTATVDNYSNIFIHKVLAGNTSKEELKGIEEAYQKLGFYAYYSRGYANSNNEMTKAWLKSMMNTSDSYIFIGMPGNVYQERAAKWEITSAQTKSSVIKLSIAFVGIIILGSYLLLVTGRKPGDEEVHFHSIDKVWSEVQWIGGGLLVTACLVLLEQFFYYGRNIQGELNWDFYFCLGVLIIGGTLFLGLVLSQLRRIKAKKFLEGFICIRILIKVYQQLRKIWMSGKISRRAVILAILLPLLCATWVGAPFVIAGLIYLIYKYMGDFERICQGVKLIRGGQLNHEIVVKSDESTLKELAEDINLISQGLEKSVSNELRSERLKAELISNVSHDLKTPLTSIVTYVDLLKQEEINNDTAKDYIAVIDRKTQRLTTLTHDLFEAAKASSGDMPVNLEKVNLNAIIRQALGEFDEKLQTAELNIRTNLPEQAVYIKADGRLTWRVMDNLLSNVVKYALTGSRVYIDVEPSGDKVMLTMKNISAHELNIPANELMERFKRGDEARNSEGSGLGLSIANSLMDLQRGTFQIDIDGDLFKVTLVMRPFIED